MTGRARTLVILGAAVAACLAATAWLVLSEQTADDPGANSGAAADGGANDATRPERPKRQGSATVFGEIRRSAGRTPVAGQEVRLAPPKGDAWTVTTDASGAFRFEHVPHGGPYELSAAAPGRGTIRIPGIALDRNEKRNVGTLWLDPSVRVTVRVRDGADAPVSGARVEAFVFAQGGDVDWSKALAQVGQAPVAVTNAQTDANGEARFDEIAVGAWTFAATKEGYATGGAEIEFAAGEEPRPVTIHLARGHPLDGRVLDSAGRAVANALVMAGDGDSAWSPGSSPLRARTKSGEDGRYAFAALASGDTTLWVARPGGAPAPAATVLIPRVAHYDLVLPAEGTLRGTVSEKGTGRPVEGAVVRASSWEGDRAYGSETATDAEGRYALSMAAGVVNELIVEKEGLVQTRDERPDGSDRVAVLQEGVVVERDLTMERGARLAGTVRGDGAPLAGARVLIAVGTTDDGFTQVPAVTGADGRYEFAALPKGRFLLLAERDGWYLPGAPRGWWEAANEPGKEPAFEIDIPEKGEASRDFEMHRGVTVSGTVRGADGAPIGGARVSAKGGAESAPTGEDGAFRLEGITPGPDVPFRCRREGYFTQSQVSVAVAEDAPTTGVVLRMDKAPRVRGTVTLRGGGAPAEARVLVAAEDSGGDEMPWTQTWRWQNATRLPVRADGTFDGELQNASGERLVVRAESDAYAPADAKPVPMVPGQESYEFHLVLEPGVALTGRVTSKSGEALAGADVFVAPHVESGGVPSFEALAMSVEGVETPVWAVSAADGSFEVSSIAAGRYDVRVAARGFVPHTITGSAGGAPVEIALSPELSIEGTVTYADGRPVEGLEVGATADEDTPSFGGLETEKPPAITDARGAFRVTGLAEGTFDVHVSVPWGARINARSKTVAGVAAGTRDLAVTVEEGGRIRGRVIDGGRRPVANVGVSLHRSSGDDEDESEEDGSLRATSGADGTFEVVGLGRGPYDLRADAYGDVYRPAQLKGVAVGGKDVEVVMEPGLAISGVLTGDGRPIARASLILQNANDDADDALAQWKNVWTDAEGRFSFDGLAPGAYRIELDDSETSGADWYLDSRTAIEAGATGLRLVATRGGSVSGSVVDEHGRPVAGATVSVSDPRDRGNARSAATSDDGRFQVIALPPEGRYIVEASAKGRVAARVRDVEPGATNVRLVLAAARPTSGRVVGADGKPLAGVALMLVRTDTATVTSTRTDPSGRFSVETVAEGEYEVRARVAGPNGKSEWKPCGTLRAGEDDAELRVQE